MKAVYRIAVGDTYEFMELHLEAKSLNDLESEIDNLTDDLIGKLGDSHREIGGRLRDAYENGYQAAKKLLTEGLGATELSETPVENDVPAWKRKIKPAEKPWQKPQGLEDF